MNKNEYVKDDISHLISKTVLQYVNESIDEKKYTIKDIEEIFDSANVMSFYFVDDYSKSDRSDEYNINSTRFYKIIEKLSEHREKFTLEEYSQFIQSMGHPENIIQLPSDIYTHHLINSNVEKYLNHYIFLIEQAIKQGEEKFINFVKLVDEIYEKYRPHNLPTYDEWKDYIMDKNNNFEIPALMILPIISQSYSE